MKRFLTRLLTVGMTALALGPGSAPGKEDAPVPEAVRRAFEARFEKVRAEYAKWNEEFEKEVREAEDALEVGKLRKEAAPTQLGYLRFVMMLEEDFWLLSHPVDSVDEDLEVPEFSRQEVRKVVSLRQEIRDAERERILAEIEDGRGMRSDEKVEKDLYRDEMSLDSLYERNVSKLVREIARVERDLAKEQISERRDDRKVEELGKELEEMEKTLGATHRFVYGFAPGVGFDLGGEADQATADGRFLASLAAERRKVIQSVRGEEAEGGEGRKKGGLVGGSFIYSSNLGVVLDVSGSMAPHIEELKEEIAETFELPRYREVAGCRLHGGRYGALTLQGLVDAKADTMSVIEELTTVWGVDTVYWFCDLRDGFDYRGLRRLRHLLLRSGADFHVKSMALRPERELKPLIDDFQG